MDQQGYKAIEECQEELENLNLDTKILNKTKINILELDKDLISSLMMLELKKREELRTAHEYFQRIRLMIVPELNIKLFDFCKENIE